ncbi:MAG: TetR/AcrR family transcriptional regulator [Actinomycetota bacterium]|nr:TetR/AcrR family transcriptional regulator [Actinomycetota bacterium]
MRQVATREDYYAAAMQILATQGAGGLKLSVLCTAVKVTTGSFYGYFGSFDGFVEQFLTFWKEQQTERLVAVANLPEDPVERVHTMKRLGRSLPHSAEAAIRSWAHTNAAVAIAQKGVDERRVDSLIQLFEPIVGSREHAESLAVLGITLLVGLQDWRSPVTEADFDRIFDVYERAILATRPA